MFGRKGIGELFVNLVAETASFQRDMRKAAAETTAFQQNITRMGKAATGAFAGFITVDTAIRAITALGRAGIEAERSQMRLAGVLRATGHSAGLTAAEIARFAEEMQRVTLFDDEEVKDAAAALATFRSIQGEVFRDTLKLAADMSSIFGQNMRSSVVQLGKALEDPKRGLSSLREIGVNFSEAQRGIILRLVEQNRLFEAQREILKGVGIQMAGTAEAMAAPDSLLGATNRLADAWSDLLERIAETPSTSNLAVAGINAIAQALERLGGTESIADQIARLEKQRASLRTTSGQLKAGGLVAAKGFILSQLGLGLMAGDVPTDEELENAINRLKGRQAGETMDAFFRASIARQRESAPEVVQLTEAQVKLFDALKQTRVEFGMSAQEIELYRLQLAGATPEMIAFHRVTLAMKAAEDLNRDAAESAQRNRQRLAAANVAVIRRDIRALEEEKKLREEIQGLIKATPQVDRHLAELTNRMDILRFRFEGLFTDSLMGEIRGIEGFARRVVGIFARMFAEIAAQRAAMRLFGEVGSSGGGFLGDVLGGIFRTAAGHGPAPATGAARLVGAGSGGGVTVVNQISPTIMASDAASFARQLRQHPDVFSEMMLETFRTSRGIVQLLGAELRGAGALA